MDNDTSSEETIDFFFLEEDIYNNLKLIWQNIFLPYIKSNDNILNLNENDFHKFAAFFNNNSKYYKFVMRNL